MRKSPARDSYQALSSTALALEKPGNIGGVDKILGEFIARAGASAPISAIARQEAALFVSHIDRRSLSRLSLSQLLRQVLLFSIFKRRHWFSQLHSSVDIF